jgi:gamma-glutamyltranspeptidase/glutathione hydrolase
MEQPTRYRQLRGAQAAAVTGHPAATAVAARTLDRGGNAVDAALAAASALAVVRPHMCGVGADGFMLMYDAKSKQVHVLNAAGPAPATAGLSHFAAGMPDRGPATSSVPGIVDGWGEAHRRFGRMAWGDVLQPAIELAERGFPAYRSLSQWIAKYEGRYAADKPCASVFLPDGRVPAPGEVLRQPLLAGCLRRLARHGARDFYEGEVAASLTRYMRGSGGLITAQDLSAYHASWAVPVRASYRGCTVHTQPPTSQGWMLAQMAGALDGIDVRSLGCGTPELTLALVNVVQAAFEDRNPRFGDPKFVPFEVGEYLTPGRFEEIRTRIRSSVGARPYALSQGGDTTSLSVVDADGNGVAMIQSLYVDAAAMTPDTGILFNGRLTSCSTTPGHPNVIAGGKTPVHTMHTYLVTRDDRLCFLGGTPGGHSQIQTNLQVLINMIDFGMEPQAAVEAPRFLVGGAMQADTLSTIFLEGRMSRDTETLLVSHGADVTWLPDWAMDWVEGVNLGTVGSEKMIAIEPVTGVRALGVDPRRDAHGVAW